MENTYSLTKSFVSKEVFIFNQTDGWKFKIILKTVRDFFEDDDWNSCYNLWTLDESGLKKAIPAMDIKNSFEFLNTILFTLGWYKEYNKIASVFANQLKKLIPLIEINYNDQTLVIDKDNYNIIVTEEIWEYVIYVIKLSCGEKVEAPIHFTSPEAKQFYLAQKAAEEEVRRIKSQANKDKDGLIKTMLSIIYAFPSITFDYLFNQTMAQIHWLSKFAAESVSYNVNAQAFAAGNMKKGKKLDFFIK